MWILACAALCLSGCALGDLPTPQTPCLCGDNVPATPVRAPQVNISGICNETELLQVWLGDADRTYNGFVAVMNSAADRPPDEIAREISEMSTWRTELSNLPVPDCAEQGQQLLIEGMDLALDVFQQYAGGSLSDVRTRLWDAQARFDTFQQIYDMLSLQARTQEQIATLHPSTQP